MLLCNHNSIKILFSVTLLWRKSIKLQILEYILIRWKEKYSIKKYLIIFFYCKLISYNPGGNKHFNSSCHSFNLYYTDTSFTFLSVLLIELHCGLVSILALSEKTLTGMTRERFLPPDNKIRRKSFKVKTCLPENFLKWHS